MAVVKLRLIMATGSENYYEKTLSVCAKEPDFHFENAIDIAGASGYNVTKSDVNPYASALPILDGLASSFNLKIELDKTYDKLPEPMTSAEIEAMTIELERWQHEYGNMALRKSELLTSIHESEQIISQLEHLESSNIPIDKLVDFEYFRFRFGRLPRESYESIKMYSSDLEDMIFFPSFIDRQEVWGMYFVLKSRASRIDALFNSLSFERVRISERAHGMPAQEIESFRLEISSFKTELSELELKMTAYSSERQQKLREYSERILGLNRIFELRKRTAFIKGAFFIVGWVPASQAHSLSSKLEQIDSVSCTIEKPTASDKQTPPTILKNNSIFRPFEDFVRMYGMPSYNEMDPTPFVALTYFLFFGMMFGDVGQGLVLLLVGSLMWFIKRLNLGRVIATVGVSSTIFGFFYGSVFGFEDIIHGFNPMENINTTLFAAVGIGIVTIVLVMILNISNGIRQRDIRKIVLSPNGLAGLLLYIAAVIVAMGMFDLIGSVMPPWVLFTIIAIMLALLFLAHPLASLLERRKDWMPENKFEFLLESFFELFEVILSFLTNTISFIRIGAFALSHVGMMTVVFLLAETASGQNPIILIIGNIFVIGFEGLIVGIQVLRLEFYELFGRFFDGDGHVIEPISTPVLGIKD